VSSDFSQTAGLSNSILNHISQRFSTGVSVELTTKDCQAYFNQPQKVTFINRYLSSVFRTIGAGLPAWYLTPDQLHFIVTGISKTDVNRLIYNFINLTNQLSRRRFRHDLWRNGFKRKYLSSQDSLQHELQRLDLEWRSEAVRWQAEEIQTQGVTAEPGHASELRQDEQGR
jgi:REP element-mobilizing transposase RayT